MSAASDALAARLRPLLAATPDMVEKRIVGGIGFMFRGNLAIGTTAKGDLLVRIDPLRQADALQRPGAHQPHMGSRPMIGFIAIAEAGIPDDAALIGWIAYAIKFAETLPPK